MREKEFYIKIYNSILEDSNLNSNDKIIYSIINNFDDSKLCWISNKILAERTNISKRTIQNSINKLIKLNYLSKYKFRKGSKTYRILSSKKIHSINIDEINTKIELFDYNWLED